MPESVEHETRASTVREMPAMAREIPALARVWARGPEPASEIPELARAWVGEPARALAPLPEARVGLSS